MGRPKEFNPNQAMKEAMEAFWERGYHGTSVNDLLAEMGLNRGSLYDTFGDKKSLFLATLAEYEKQGRRHMAEILQQPGSPRKAIEQWVRTEAQTCSGPAGLRGCLGMKAAMEMAPHDADVAAWVKQIARERDQLIVKTIKRGQAAGEINPRLDAKVLARYLGTALAGLKIMGIRGPSEREVSEVVSIILGVLVE